MERDDGTRSTHERLSHQRVMLGGPHDAQISVHRPRLSAQAHIWMGSPADTCGVCTVLAKSDYDCAAMERDDSHPIDTREADPPAGGAGWASRCSNIGTPATLERAGAHFDGAAPWTACVRSVSAREKRLCYDGARRLHPIDTREAVPPAGGAG